MPEDILEPLKAYNDIFKQKFNDTATTYFDELVKTSQIDVPANRKTIKEMI